jgi:hypothetical protein
MPGPLEGPLGPLPNMFWDPVRAKYFPNPRQSTAVPNQPRQERPNMRPPSPTRNSKTIMTHMKEMSLNEDPESSSAAADSGSSTANTCRRRKFNGFRRLDGSGAGVLKSTLSASTHQDRMRGSVHQMSGLSKISSDRQIRRESLDQPRAPKYGRRGGFGASYRKTHCESCMLRSYWQSLMIPGRLAMHRLPSDVRFRTNGVPV